jgi:hypothetical protein
VEDAIWQLTATAESFAKVAVHSEDITVEKQPSVYVLRYLNKTRDTGPRLVDATLTVRRRDLHPIQQVLNVERNGEVREYRFAEVRSDETSVASVRPAVFELDACLLVANGSRAAVLPVQPAFTPANPELQLSVIDALDKSEAFVREQAAVSRTEEGTLNVSAVVANDQRKDELVRALGPLGHSSSIQLMLRTATSQRVTDSQPVPVVVQTVELAETKLPVDDILRSYFAAQGKEGNEIDHQIQDLSNDVLDYSLQAQLYAQALKQISNSFSVSEIQDFSPAKSRQWHALLNRNAEAVGRQLELLRARVEPVWHGGAPGAASDSPLGDADMIAATGRLLEFVSSIAELTRHSFAHSVDGKKCDASSEGHFHELMSKAESTAATIAISTRN